MKRATLVAAIVAASAMIPEARAGTATSNMNVTATVASTCSISAGSLAFGTYNTLSGTQVDGTTTVSVACTKGATATITLGQGQNAGTGSTDAIPIRRMVSGANFLSYALFSDSTRLVTWGNTVITGQAYVALSAVTTQLTVYGRIAASQDVPAGSFSDVVLATITF
jgi:spore coat protein U-like protein